MARSGIKAQKRIRGVLFYVIAALLAAIEVFPFLYMVLTSFQAEDSAIFTIPPSLIPKVWY